MAYNAIDDKTRRRVHKLIAESVTKADIAKRLGICRDTVIKIAKEVPPPKV